MTDPHHRAARAFRDALEPVIGSVYFAPECHRRYEALGFGPSPMTSRGVEIPEGTAYFCSRGGCLGQVPGQVVAAAFAVFNPIAVAPLVDHGWTIADPSTLVSERRIGAVEQLGRIIGEEPEELDAVGRALTTAIGDQPVAGRPLYAGMVAVPEPVTPWERLFVAGDRIREFRGDSHNAAWTAAGLSAVEIGLLTELFWNLPMVSYIRTRAWSDDDIGAAQDSLRSRGYIDDEGFTDAGRAAREDIEAATDEQMRSVMQRLEPDVDLVMSTLAQWSTQVIAAGGYPGAASVLTDP